MTFLIKTTKFFDSIISTLAVSLFLIMMIFGFYALYDAYDVYNSALLQEDIITLNPNYNQEDYSFDLSELKDINSDIIGWITLNDTNIDYPILKAKDNLTYLNTNYKKEYSAAGSIFMDYRNNNFLDDYSVIYGHNMNFDLMFGDIKNYKDYSFFHNHLEGVVYLENDRYHLIVMDYAVINAYDKIVFGVTEFMNGRNTEIVHHLQRNATFVNEREKSLNEGEKLLLLSTCDASGVNVRSVLLTKLVKVEDKEDLHIQSKEENTVKNAKKIVTTDDFPKISLRSVLIVIFVLLVIGIYFILFLRKRKAKRNKKLEDEFLIQEEINNNSSDDVEEMDEFGSSKKDDSISSLKGKKSNTHSTKKKGRNSKPKKDKKSIEEIDSILDTVDSKHKKNTFDDEII